MSRDENTAGPNDHDEFSREAQQHRVGLAAEFWDFLKHNKKWWLLPILAIMALIALIIVLGSSPAAPFIYPLF